MGGEPWCFAPAVIATLTDHVIDETYLKPAVRKAEAMERERKGLPPLPTAGAGAGPAAENSTSEPTTAPPHRETVVATAVAVFGKTRAQAEAEYDAQLAAWEARKAKG